MNTPTNTTCIEFLNYSAHWLHWSYLDSNWKKDEITEDYLSSTSSTQDEGSRRINMFHKVVHFVLAYAAGSFGHLLCSITKIGMVVLFIFVNGGLALHYAVGALKQKATKTNDLKELRVRKFYLFEGLLIMGLSIPAFLIDVLGILCPPFAYHTHDYAKKNLMNPSFKQVVSCLS